jgi:ribosomal protein L11 methyltransferase
VQGDLTKGLDVKAQIVVANLVAEAIIELAASVKPCLAVGGIFISSGILNEKQAAVVSALDQQGFMILEILEKGDWCAIAAK